MMIGLMHDKDIVIGLMHLHFGDGNDCWLLIADWLLFIVGEGDDDND